MNRSLLALAILTIAFVGWLGATWLAQPPSHQELLANYAKIEDYARGVQSVGGWVWWTPSFQQGSVLAPVFSTILTNLSVFLFSSLAGLLAGPKLAGLFFLAVSPFAMYLFVRRLASDEKMAAIAGALYLLSPSLLLRLGFVEHISVVAGMALLPLIFWSVLSFIEAPNIYHGAVCAMCCSLVTLAYAKIAVLTFPILCGFALWAWIERGKMRMPSLAAMAVCVGGFILLAVLFNLPGFRENAFVAQFKMAPFDAWQHAFSFRSAIAWVNPAGLLTVGAETPSPPGRDGAFPGVANMLILGLVFALRRDLLHHTPAGCAGRLLLALALFAQWLSYGAYSAITSQIAFLTIAEKVPHPAIAISWALLILQVWLIFLLLPRDIPWRKWIGTIASIVYLFVPGFRLLEKLPLYSEIRAPYDIFHSTGIFCVCAAGGILALLLFRSVAKPIWRISGTVALLALFSLDTYGTTRDFRRSPLDQKTYDDFLAATDFLKTAPVPGRVQPFSGRYFYLLTPVLSGRGLVNEAFNSYYAQKWMDAQQKGSFASRRDQDNFWDIGGVSYIFFDRKDPSTPSELYDIYSRLLPVAFQNESFSILVNDGSLSPAFLASDFYRTDIDTPAAVGAAIELIRYKRPLIYDTSPEGAAKNILREEEDGNIILNKEYKTVADKDFTKVSELAPRNKNYHEIALAEAPSGGLLIVPESYHPDWTASANAKPVPVYRALGGMLSALVPPNAGPVTFHYKAPWWYNTCASLGLLSWLTLPLFIGLTRMKWLPGGLRQKLVAIPALAAAPAPQVRNRPPIQRPLLVLPTYNERESLGRTLDLTFASHPAVEVLVVDDNSPDKTAEIVQSRPEFKHRLHLVQRSGKLGLGSAYKEGFQWAMSREYDACLEMDADLSHDPKDIPRLIQTLDEDNDLAVGSRYLNGIRVMNWPEERLLLSTFASRYVRTLTRLPLTDATSGFKAIRTDALRGIDWGQLRAEGYGFQIELHYQLWQGGWRIKEVPIVFTERSEGQTKMTVGIAIEAALSVLRLAIDQRFSRRKRS